MLKRYCSLIHDIYDCYFSKSDCLWFSILNNCNEHANIFNNIENNIIDKSTSIKRKMVPIDNNHYNKKAIRTGM